MTTPCSPATAAAHATATAQGQSAHAAASDTVPGAKKSRTRRPYYRRTKLRRVDGSLSSSPLAMIANANAKAKAAAAVSGSKTTPETVTSSTQTQQSPSLPLPLQPARAQEGPEENNNNNNNNAYDSILAECQDLMLAATQAQQLGRLKMANSYLLLLHARLIGLGRWFDKVDIAEDDDENGTDDEDEGDSREDGENPNSNNNIELTPKTRAVKQFTRLLPRDLLLDQQMMDHLAQAACELHAKRQKKQRQQQQQPRSTLRTASSTTDDLATATAAASTAANQQRIESAVADQQIIAPPALVQSNDEISTTASTTIEAKNSGMGIAWSEEEMRVLNQATTTTHNVNGDGNVDNVDNDTNNPAAVMQDLAKLAALLPGRSEQQVELYLKNREERKRVQLEANVNEQVIFHNSISSSMVAVENTVSTTTGSSDHHNISNPLAVAAPTVRNMVCDVRALIQQGKITTALLQSRRTPSSS